MDLVLHIGAPKTGSTAIQQALAHDREVLRTAGILYPRLLTSNSNHTMLTTGIYSQEVSLGRLVRPRVKATGKTRREIYQQELSFLREQIVQAKPSCSVLSSEAFFRSQGKMELGNFIGELGVPAEKVFIVCYLRNPADHYLSLVQQSLKHSSKVKRPAPYSFRRVLEGYMLAFPGRVRIRIHGPGVDVVKDFMSIVAANVPVDVESRKRNETVSAEIMQIVQDFRLVNYPDSDNVPVTEVTRLWRKLRQAESRLGLSKRPRLKPEVRQYIIARARADIEWLNAHLDQPVEWLQQAGETLPPMNIPAGKKTRVSDICEIDEAHVQALLEYVARKEVGPSRKAAQGKTTLGRRIKKILASTVRFLVARGR